MDRKQAVTILKRKTTIPGDGYTWEQINEAIDMAIAALSPPNEPLTIEQLRAELEQVKRERDAAIRDLEMVSVCDTCVHEHAPSCPGCNDAENWEWRGPEEG